MAVCAMDTTSSASGSCSAAVSYQADGDDYEAGYTTSDINTDNSDAEKGGDNYETCLSHPRSVRVQVTGSLMLLCMSRSSSSTSTGSSAGVGYHDDNGHRGAFVGYRCHHGNTGWSCV